MSEQNSDRIIRDAEVGSLTGLSRTTRWRLVKQQKFPRPIKLSPAGSAIGWRESDIQSWIRSLQSADHIVKRKREAA